MFSTEHFIWIAICFVFVLTMTLVSVKKRFSLKLSGYIMCGICTVSEISKMMSDMEESSEGGMHLSPTSLPFHLCSLMIFAVFFITFGKDGKFKKIIIDFIAVMGTLGSFCAILIPTNGTDFLDIGSYQCFVYHAGLMWFSLYLVFSKKAEMTVKSTLRNMLFLTFLSLMMIYVNGALSAYETNFFFITRPPLEGLPYLNLNHGWYAYFLKLFALGVLLISLFTAPFIIASAVKKKREANAPSEDKTENG